MSGVLQVTVVVCIFAFDLLYMDGVPLVHLPLRERRVQFQAALPKLLPGHVELAHAVEMGGPHLAGVQIKY